MSKIKIEGIPGYDGEYDFDFSDFTVGEMFEIESFSGVPFARWSEGHYRFAMAVALPVLRRAGKPIVEGMILGAPHGAILLVEDEVDDAGPPALSKPLSSGGVPSSSASSGSESGSENQADRRKGTGGPGSETTADSAPETSGS